MREQHRLEAPPSRRPYKVDDTETERLINELLAHLGPYPNLDIVGDLLTTAAKLAKDGCDRGDAKILRASAKELRYAFKVFAAYRDYPKVSVFGSARVTRDQPEYHSAETLGRKLAEAGFMVITGAGPGIMEAGLEGAGQDQGFGLNIRLPYEQAAADVIHQDKKLINFRYFFTRKLFFVKESHAIVLLPGGFGTHDEGFEALTLIQTGKADMKPVVMLDAPGGRYWHDWFQFIDRQLIARGFISPQDKSLFLITDSVEAACAEIQTFYRVYHSARFVDHRRTLVLRLKRPPEPAVMQKLNEQFRDIVLEGAIEPAGPFPEEADEPRLLGLPRLAFRFDQRQYSRLRELINAVNAEVGT
jgi:uncharacterized protein (TIGR00730 family)